LTIADEISLMGKGGVHKLPCINVIFCENDIAKCFDSKGNIVSVTPADTQGYMNVAFFPNLVASFLAKERGSIKEDLNEGEVISKTPMTEPSLIKLSRPIYVKQNDVDIPIEWLEFKPKTYGEVETYIDSLWGDEKDRIIHFIQSFASPVSSGASFLTIPAIKNMLLQDAARIERLIERNFLRLDEILWEIVED
jgi:hypothetical protein